MKWTKWVHESGEADNGACLACILELGNIPIRPHAVEPDPDGDRDTPYCHVCGHDVVVIDVDAEAP